MLRCTVFDFLAYLETEQPLNESSVSQYNFKRINDIGPLQTIVKSTFQNLKLAQQPNNLF